MLMRQAFKRETSVLDVSDEAFPSEVNKQDVHANEEDVQVDKVFGSISRRD